MWQLFSLIQKQCDIRHQSLTLNNLTDQIEQSGQIETSTTKIMIIKLLKKYCLVVIYHEILYLIDYTQCNVEQMNFFLSKILEDEYEIRLIRKTLEKDSTSLYFYFIFQMISGLQIDTIDVTQYDEKFSYDRIVWLILKYGFNSINNEFQRIVDLEDQLEEEGFETEKNRALSELRQHQRIQEKKKMNNLRLKTPKTIKERQQEMKLLNERLSYLKVLNGEANEDDILQTEMFQIRMRKLNKNIDEEFKSLDLQKQSQLLYQSSQNQLVKNASEILKGKFNSQLFAGLGLSIPENKVEALSQIQQQNYTSILDPILRQQGQQLPPGEFAKTQKENLIAMKYGIKISRDALHELRYGRVRPEIINLYCKFLEEYSQTQNEKQAFMRIEDFDDIIFEQRTGKEFSRQKAQNYLSNYDVIYFPIKQGQLEEFSLGLIDMKNLTIKHFFLCQQRVQQPLSSLQQVFKTWQVRDTDMLNEVQSRQDLQHKYLQLLIYWIRKQANINNLQKISNMRLWKIRIEEINTVASAQETAKYLLSVLTNCCIKSTKVDKPVTVVIAREIIENIICTTGIQDKISNRYAEEYFHKQIMNLIK